MASSVPLSIALPAAAGVAAYLDAKYHIRKDLHLLSNFIGTSIEGAFIERRDKLNLFYTLEDWAKAPTHANKDFLLFAGKSYTYSQAYEIVIKYGQYLKQKHNVQKNEVVAIDFVNSDCFVWLWLGLWSIGAKPAFVNYNLTGKPLLHCLKTSTARLVLVDPDIAANFDDNVLTELSSPNFRTVPEGGAVEIALFDAPTRAAAENMEAVRPGDEERSGQKRPDMAVLIYTSGTTGLPKPAVVSWAKVGLASRFCGRWIPLRKDDVMYTCMPLYHSSASILCFSAVLNTGCTLSLGAKFHRTQFWNDVRSTNATVIQYVGETCRYLLSAPPSPLDTQHKVRLAFGNGLRPDVWPVFRKRFGIRGINEFYAATEGPAALWNLTRNEFGEGAVGMTGLLARTMMGNKAALLELDFETNLPVRNPSTGFCTRVPTNSPGELVYALDPKDIASQFQGYFGNKNATSTKILRDVFKKGDAFFSTGDVMRMDSEGRWFFCDRIGDTFRWKSENVSTAEVSEILGASPYVSEANVYGVQLPHHDGRAGCAALILSSSSSSTTEPPSEILADISQRAFQGLPRYAVPIFLRILHPTTAAQNTTGNNKQQKHVLREQGVDVGVVEKMSDGVFWLRPGTKEYTRFTAKDWNELKGGKVKL